MHILSMKQPSLLLNIWLPPNNVFLWCKGVHYNAPMLAINVCAGKLYYVTSSPGNYICITPLSPFSGIAGANLNHMIWCIQIRM